MTQVIPLQPKGSDRHPAAAEERRRLGATYGEDPPAATAPRLSGRSSYSLFVGVMKVLLPAVAVALVLLVIAWPRFERDEKSFRTGISDLVPEEVSSSAMVNARFEGVDERGRPFSVTADTATQVSADGNQIDLEGPKGDIFTEDGTWIAVTADTGFYNRKVERLDLSGNVNLFHDKGYELRTESARVNLRSGVASGSQPVEAQGPFGLINAEGFRVKERGAVIIFTGKSHLTLYQEDAIP